ncbi:MAG: pro-sigmaK processing inhibitor BofA family protein [Candidatus Marsarchaeota archaeon]|nr:pro-sigmaK processing inhibitor BofA family protein [Candidatus Marsarchaeota archaeon]
MLASIALPLLSIFAGSVVSETLIIVAIIAVIFIVFALGRFLLGLLVNSILGLIALFLINAIFGLAIPITLATIAATAIFGLPAVFVIVILKLGGML